MSKERHWYEMTCSNSLDAKNAVQWCKRRELSARQKYNFIEVLLSDEEFKEHREELEFRYRLKGTWSCHHLHGLKLKDLLDE